MIYDLIIIGSGPAGLTAGIYAARSKLNVVVLEGPLPGGQLMTTTNIENWPGEKSILGAELMMNIMDHAKASGCSFLSDSVVSVDFSQKLFSVATQTGKQIEGKAVIIATGAVNKRLACPGEDEYFSKGVSTCATCDGPFFQGKEVFIVGGGNTAMTEAEHLTHFASKVTVVHILDKLTANDPITDKVMANPKVQFLYNAAIQSIHGDGLRVTHAMVKNQKTDQIQQIPVDGIFLAIGFKPNTTVFAGQIELDQYGYIVVKNHTQTSVDGIFAAGDVSDYRYRQAITSAGVGCMALLDAQSYLMKI